MEFKLPSLSLSVQENIKDAAEERGPYDPLYFTRMLNRKVYKTGNALHKCGIDYHCLYGVPILVRCCWMTTAARPCSRDAKKSGLSFLELLEKAASGTIAFSGRCEEVTGKTSTHGRCSRQYRLLFRHFVEI